MKIVLPQHFPRGEDATLVGRSPARRSDRSPKSHPSGADRDSCSLSRSGSRDRAFTLVEVTIALGLVSFTLLSLLGLFVVGLTSSRNSSLETALSQIAIHVASTYNTDLPNEERAYSYEGGTSNAANFRKYFTVNVSSTNSDSNRIPNTTSNLRLITISITSANIPGVTNIIQTAAFVP